MKRIVVICSAVAHLAIIETALSCSVRAGDLSNDIVLLAKIKRKTVEDLSRVASFTCLATYTRAERSNENRAFVRVDQVRAEIAYVNGQELFALPGSPHFDSESLAQIVGTGLVGSGEFIAHARSVFISDAGAIRFGAMEEYLSRPAVRYDFQISPSFSGYRLTVPEGTAILGLKGSFWADRRSNDLLALSISGDEIPPRLGVRSIQTEIEYRRTRISAASPILIPQSAATTLVYTSAQEKRYDVQYTHCREYAANSTISFDPPQQGRAPAAPRPPAEFSIPALLVCRTRLVTPIDSDKTSVGDSISANIAYDVRRKGEIVLPAGALLTGRIRVLQKDAANRFLVGLEFTDVTFDGKHARFFADLQGIDQTGGVRMLLQSAKTNTNEHVVRAPGQVYGTVELETRENTLPPQLPGVATFFVLKTQRFELPSGFEMEWRTIPLKRQSFRRE